MKTIKRYGIKVEADLAKSKLDSAGIPAFVIGLGIGMEGGMEGIELQVPEDQVEAALEILGDD